MKKSAVLAIDQGTTGTRAVLYDPKANFLGSAYQEFPQHFPLPGWVEHDAEKIWKTTALVVRQVLRQTHLNPRFIKAIGITNQRETVVAWDGRSSKPLHRAIVWQDRRTAEMCGALKKRGLEKTIHQKTGLLLDPYFSATKMRWLLEKVPAVKKAAKNKALRFGTIDSWLLWKLTGGKSHATDFTNASRTLLFNIVTKQWDAGLLKTFRVPSFSLPKVLASGSLFGETESLDFLPDGIPVFAMMGDQQAALYGQGCYQKGGVKNTYGTGCFTVLNLGTEYQKPPFGLLATLACDEKGYPVYAAEGSIFIGGAVIQWLRDGLGFFKKAEETQKLIHGLKDTGGVTVVPAFAGLGSPYWNPHARGMISGITRGTTKAHITRAALESIAQQSADVIEQMKKTGSPIRELRVDGGATRNPFLMQFQADLLGMPILISDISESTAWGAAKLAAYRSGFWKNLRLIDRRRRYKKFLPRLSRSKAAELRLAWRKEVGRVLLGL